MFKPRNLIALAVVAIAFVVFDVWFSVANPAYRLSDHAAEAFVRSSPEVVQWVGPIKSISKPWVNAGRSLADWGDGGPKCLRTVAVLVVEGQAKTSRIRVGMASLNDGPWQLKALGPQTFEESTHERQEDDYGFSCS